MSKNFVKILSICAFVIILPLAILGTALCVTARTTQKLKVNLFGDNGHYATTPVVKVNDIESKNNEWNVVKGSDVTVTIQLEGYNFKGWFDGKYSIEDDFAEVEAKETSEEYTLTINGDTVLIAKVAVQKFNVTYQGIESIPQETLEYGQPLHKVSDNALFKGWTYSGAPVDSAKFKPETDEQGRNKDLSDVTVVAQLDTQKAVSYYDAEGNVINGAGGLFTEEEFSTYQLLTKDDTNVKNALGKEWRFKGWKYKGQEFGSAQLAALKEQPFTSDALELYMDADKIEYKKVTYYKADKETVIETKTWEDIDFKANFKLLGADEVKSYVTDGYIFVGWVDNLDKPINVDELKTNFTADDLNIYMKEEQIKEKTIRAYSYDKTTSITLDKTTYTQAEFVSDFTFNTLPTKEAVVRMGIKPGDGYEFDVWKTVDGDVEVNEAYISTLKANFTEGELKIYLTRKVITYNVTASYYSVVEGKDVETKFTFDIESKFPTEYSVDRGDYYEFVGFKFNGKTYEYDQAKHDYKVSGTEEYLSTAIVSVNPAEVQLTAVWKAKYETLNVEVKGFVDGTNDEDGVYTSETGTKFDPEADDYTFEDAEGRNDYFQKLFDLVCGQYEHFYKLLESGSYQEVHLSGAKITFGNDQGVKILTKEMAESLDFNDIIEALEGKALDLTQKITIYFYFA